MPSSRLPPWCARPPDRSAAVKSHIGEVGRVYREPAAGIRLHLARVDINRSPRIKNPGTSFPPSLFCPTEVIFDHYYL